jgi:hypothetical protein
MSPLSLPDDAAKPDHQANGGHAVLRGTLRESPSAHVKGYPKQDVKSYSVK